MKLVTVALKSALNRKLSLSLTVLSLAISIMLLLGVDKIRKEAKNNFVNTISQTDLIVGARSGPINLLLYSVFRIGNATNNVSWKSYQEIAQLQQVKWSVPLSLGDSHRGFRVLGTLADYFTYYRYAGDRALQFESGGVFQQVYDVVLGADVARELTYRRGDKIIVSHGLASTEFSAHGDKPFTVVGILKKTGTPVDRTVHVPLEGISAIHIDWQSGRRSVVQIDADQAAKMDLRPKEITAFMLGLNNRIATFRVQRKINEYASEPLMAIIPGATLSTLWFTLGSFEMILLTVSALVVLAGLAGMLTTVISSLNERRREMAVFRAIGAHPYQIILLFVLETFFIIIAAALGVLLLYLLLAVSKPIILNWIGISLQISPLDVQQWLIVLVIVGIALLSSLIPGLIAYRRSLQDGLMIRV